MKKILKTVFLFSFIALLCYIFISIGFRNYVSKNTKIEIFGTNYTQFNYLESNFVPFGSDNSWYNTDARFCNLFGLSFMKTDKEKNFIYYKNPIGTIVYKKDSYILPEFPAPDLVDELILNYEGENIDLYIRDREQIEDIMNFLSTFSSIETKQHENTIVFYAISNSFGGIFRLNKSGTAVIEDLPDKIQDIIKVLSSSEP